MNLNRTFAAMVAATLLAAGCSNSVPKKVELLSMSPATGERGVPVLVTPTFTFSGDLDPSSVTTTAVRLRSTLANPYGPDEVPCSVTWDAATKRVVLTPGRVLALETSYTIELAPLQDGEGHILAARTIEFTTRENPELRTELRDGATVLEHDDSVYDAQGKLTSVIFYAAAGPDGLWYTGDDEIGGYWATRYDASGLLVGHSYHYEAGTDGTWLTADDPVFTCLLSSKDAQGRYTLRWTSSFPPGPDGVCFTADDAVARYSAYTYEAGKEQRVVTYSGKGADGSWFTADDVVFSYTDSAWDSAGQRTGTVTRKAGPNAVWFDDDDAVFSYVRYERDERGNTTFVPGYTGAGADAEWFTADDLAGTGTRYWFGEDRALDRTASVGAGADKAWSTADDTVTRWSAYDHDAAGNRLTQTTYKEAGADAVWYTEDDVLDYVTSFDAER